MNSTAHSPVVTHVPMIPTAGSATPKSPSQTRVSPSRPTVVSRALTGPCGSYIHCQATPITTAASTCGRKTIVRNAVSPRMGRRDSTAVTRRPRQTGASA